VLKPAFRVFTARRLAFLPAGKFNPFEPWSSRVIRGGHVRDGPLRRTAHIAKYKIRVPANCVPDSAAAHGRSLLWTMMKRTLDAVHDGVPGASTI